MLTETSRNKHSPWQLFAGAIRQGMKHLCKRNVTYDSGCMLSKAGTGIRAERRKSSASRHQTLLISYHKITYLVITNVDEMERIYPGVSDHL